MTNDQVARWLGYKPCGVPTVEEFSSMERMPDWTQDGPHWQEVYREIERRGLCKRFLDELVGYRELHTEVDLAWFILVATPAQRLAAAARVIEEVEQNG